MKFSELLERFLEFEYRNNLFEQEISGVKFWHFIRYGTYADILLKQLMETGEVRDRLTPSEMAGVEKVKAYWQRLSKYARNCFGARSLRGLSGKELLFLCSPRRVKDDDRYICPYTDTFLHDLRYSYYVLEQPYRGKHFRPVETNNLKYFDQALLKAGLKRTANKLRFRYGSSTNKFAVVNGLAEKLEHEFGVTVDRRGFGNSIMDLVQRICALSGEIEKILRKIRPRLIIEVCSYDSIHMLVTSVAKRLGIRTAELQHGIMGRYHLAYNFLEKRNLETFPDYVLLFGKYWKESTRFPVNGERLIVTGFPYFEDKVKRHRNKKVQLHDPKTVLFISQGTIGKQLSRMAVELFDTLEKSRYRVIYKLHPGEFLRWKKEYPWLADSGIEVIDNTEKSIYYYLSLAWFVVGVFSTAIFESLAFGSQIFVAKLPGHEYAEDLYGRGYARLVSSAREIAESIDEDVHHTVGQVNEFWEPVARAKVVATIEKLASAEY